MESDNENILESYVNSVEDMDDSVSVDVPAPASAKKAHAKRPVQDVPDAPAAIPQMRVSAPSSQINIPGYIDVPVESMPSAGHFYPVGTRILIKAATGSDIKYWSTLDEDNVISVDDMLDYVVEKCCMVRTPDGAGNWRDIRSIDRLYLILAVRELTFPDGTNDLKVVGKDGKDVMVRKEMLSQFVVPDGLREYYNGDGRCFTFPYDTFSINMYMPSVGVNKWLKAYVTAKVQSGAEYDESFVGYAPLLISDYRYLTDKSYETMVEESGKFGAEQWSLISYVEDLLKKGASTNLKYVDDGGVPQEAPFNFRGGIKSLFLFSNPLSRLAKDRV